MKNKLLLTLLLCASTAMARDEITDVLADPALKMSRPADRAQAVKRIEAIENARLQNARAKGRAMGLPLRVEIPGVGVRELVDFTGDEPVYLETMNASAAISTAADLVQTSPYTLNGSGLTVAVWDAGGSRLRLTFRCLKSTKRGSTTMKVQTSADLGASDPWTSHEAAVPDLDGTVNGVIFDTTDDGDFINVIADIPAAGAHLFGRLQATP